MEHLAWLIHSEVEVGNWTGIRCSLNGPTFTHIFFADDLVLFPKATKKNCTTINRVLGKFCEMSGQNIIFNKSKLILSKHMTTSRSTLLENDLGMNLSKHFGKYLGAPILNDGRDKKEFDFLLEKIQLRLAGWKIKTLSLVGRLALIQSVTTAIPTHIMQCALLPTKICKSMDKLNRSFLWDDSIEKKKIHLLNWDTVTRPKAYSGLGIKRSQCRNKALLAKRLRAFQLGSTDCWADTLKAKYSTSSAQVRSSTVWKSLMGARDICQLGKGWVVRNGNNIDFWHDNWTGLGPLRPLLMGPLHSLTVSLKFKDLRDPNGQWNFDKLSFTLPPSFEEIIKGIPIPFPSSQDDLPIWRFSSNGLFILHLSISSLHTVGNGFGNFQLSHASPPSFG